LDPGLTPAPLGAGACGRGAMSLMQSSPGCCRPCRIGVSVVKKKACSPAACTFGWLLLGGAWHGAVAWFMLRCAWVLRLMLFGGVWLGCRCACDVCCQMREVISPCGGVCVVLAARGPCVQIFVWLDTRDCRVVRLAE